MLKKVVMLIVAGSFLFILTMPTHPYSHNEGIQLFAQHGGS